METIEFLSLLQVGSFVVLGLLSIALWYRHRSRPAGYLALAFGTLGLAFVGSRSTADLAGVAADVRLAVTLGVLLLFPWALVAMAWSFAGPLPRWLRWSTFPLAAYVSLPLLATVFPTAETDTTGPQLVYVVGYLTAWSLLAAAAGMRLFRSVHRVGVVRDRMRFMAVGLAILNLAVLFAGLGAGTDRPGITVATTVLSLVAAAAFVAGFAPPLLLRVWWRRRSGQQFQRMQEALIGSATPAEVAAAVAPTLAELVGGGVAVIGRDGTIQAAAHLEADELARDRARLVSGDPLDSDTQVIEVDAYWLIVRTTAYSPVFGQGERELVDGFAIQLRLALERAELFQAHLEARGQAEAASQELEATLMGLSHDLKSPTAAIVGFATLLGGAADDGERDQLIDELRNSTRYLEELVDALLEYSTVGRTQVEVEPVPLERIVDSVARRLAGTGNATRVVVDGPLPVVLVNPVRAEQVIDNLLGNAAKHGGRDDLTITVSAEATPSGARVRISDDGRGLSDGDRERIFTLFARGEGASRSGSGVGLGMVRRIIESYGGSIDALPAAFGATFELRFPCEIVVDVGDAGGAGERSPVAGRPARK